MTAITLAGLSKRFDRTLAVDGVDLTINAGELFFLLGPSGCGKTTLLRMIAGFLEPTAGTIRFGDRDVTHLPANKRNTGMVFQSYALWPHMTVLDNVAFGLSVRKVPAAARRERAMAALDLVQMRDYADRKPNQLSGGQQQRVALARALVIQPTVLLLDEPLSNLDAKLRLEMRMQIRRICDETRITAVYVTHDQKEALSMSDRVAVLAPGGRVAQVGSPRELYARPATRFVADFLGESNFLTGVVESISPTGITIRTPAGTLLSTHSRDGLHARDSVTCSIRPEAIQIHTAAPGPNANTLPARLIRSTFLGEMTQLLGKLSDESEVKVLAMHEAELPEHGAEIALHVDPNDVVLVRE